MPDSKVAWAATEGATNAGTVTFEDHGSRWGSVSGNLDITVVAGTEADRVERASQPQNVNEEVRACVAPVACHFEIVDLEIVGSLPGAIGTLAMLAAV